MGGPRGLGAQERAHRVNVLRLRVSDDLPVVARVVVWPRDKGGYFIYVRPGTPRGDVRSAIRALKATSALRRELAVIAFAARNARNGLFPRANVMSVGAGLATLTVAASGLAVAPAIQHHGHAGSILPSWADIDPDPVPDQADHVNRPAPSAPHHPQSSPPAASPSGVPPLNAHAPRATVTARAAAPAAARGKAAHGTTRAAHGGKSGAKASAAKRQAAPGKSAKAKPAKAKTPKTKSAKAKSAMTKSAKTKQKPAKPGKSAKANKASKPGQASKAASHRG